MEIGFGKFAKAALIAMAEQVKPAYTANKTKKIERFK